MSISTLPDDAEKGLLLPPPQLASMSTATLNDDVENGTTEFIPLSTQSTLAPPEEETMKGHEKSLSLVPVALPGSEPNKPPPAKKNVSRSIRWRLWFNTYRKFFTIIMVVNLTAIVLTATGHLPYARKYTGAMVLGNLLFSILMRNELFGRFLYLVVNTLFAKVSWPLLLLLLSPLPLLLPRNQPFHLRNPSSFTVFT
jgi:hypothetical protein